MKDLNNLKEKLTVLILDEFSELARSSELEVGEVGIDSKLYGDEGALDSLGLVTLIADVEDRIAEELDLVITIADERAMSQKISPFSSVKSLVRFLERKIASQG